MTKHLCPLLFLLMLASCSKKSDSIRIIRAHTQSFAGISHAGPAHKPRRYCKHCHGSFLQGGPMGEPSCYTCHGVKWSDASSTVSSAPPSHTEIREGFSHLPGLFSPDATCSPCHGQDLSGNTNDGLTYPGCQLCHESLWNAAGN